MPKVKGEFALNVTGLVDYIKENEEILLTKAVFGGKTADLIAAEGTLMLGVKSSEKVAILDTDAIFQDGTGCARVSSGNTSLTQRQITVGNIAVVEDICVADLEKKYIANTMARGANNNKLPFDQEYSELKAAKVAKQLEIAIWQGDTTSGNANLNKFDGFIKIIDAAGGSVVQSNTAVFIPTGAPISISTGITTANVKAIVNSMWLALPADITGADDIRIFCGWDTFNKFINAFTDQNLFNFAPTGSEVSAANGVVIIPGTNYKLTAVHGLDGTNRLFAMKMTNMVEATDLESDYEDFRMMPDQFDDYLRFKMRFRFGVQVAFPDQVVTFKLV
jgi:hypothetical protein